LLEIVYTNRFEKDLKRMRRRNKDDEKLFQIIEKLIKGEKLEPKYRDHKLSGNFHDRRECHIEPDWLLIYFATEKELILERIGSHNDLFQ